nr:unnamed protein product [Callosobruchus chinensis]
MMFYEGVWIILRPYVIVMKIDNGTSGKTSLVKIQIQIVVDPSVLELAPVACDMDIAADVLKFAIPLHG